MIALQRHVDHLQTWRRAGAGQWMVAHEEFRLTTRELEVLYLLSTGLLATGIARRLLISSRTVHHHLASLYAKLGVHDRLTAVVRAQALGSWGRRRGEADGTNCPSRGSARGTRDGGAH